MASIFVAGATGFVGRHLVPALVRAGHDVRAGSRRPHAPERGVTWIGLDLEDPQSLSGALRGCEAAYFLVHGLARRGNYSSWERETAERLSRSAAQEGVRRLIYLGGLAPQGRPSRHLASRLQVGEVLRAGRVPTVELRASMLIGAGSTSWIIARDLAFRLPVMLTPRWVRHRTQPLAVEDAVAALVAALSPGVPAPSTLDLPGPETVTLQELFRRIAAHRNLRPRMLPVPLLSPWLSAQWLRLVTRVDIHVAIELVQGLVSDVLARDDQAWAILEHRTLTPLDAAIERALGDEGRSALSPAASLAEATIARLTHALDPSTPRA